jgi:hypothetical protein
VIVGIAALFLLFVDVMVAQTLDPIQHLLPAGAKIIEKADITKTVGKPRVMVLWMLNPKRAVPGTRDGSCSDSLYGDHWYGPTRLSLMNPASGRPINTIEIRSALADADEPDSFSVPFFTQNGPYFVTNPNADGWGEPRILHLRDMTGEGRDLQFALFDHLFCGTANTAAFGYSVKTDRVVHYNVETAGGDGKTATIQWVAKIFRAKPDRPGYWKFDWDPGHGADLVIHEEVSFDPKRQLFVQKSTSTPYSPSIPK